MHRSSLLLSLIVIVALSACDDGGAFEVAESDGVGGGGGAMLPDAGGEGDGDAEEDASPPDPCPPPADPKKAAICLVIEPENIDFIQGDPRFDGEGILHVAVFDKERPGLTAPLRDETLPTQGAVPVTGKLDSLTDEPVRFEMEPGTVYPRVLFLDDLEAFGADTLKPGIWLGGFDFLNTGLVETAPLRAVELEAGKGHQIAVTLSALRRMQITISRGDVTPMGDGQGALSVIALDSPALDGKAKSFGVAHQSCADLMNAKMVTVEGVVMGAGPYWVTAVLDDFGQTGSPPPGALVSFDWQTVQIPADDELSYEPRAYQVTKSIEMTAVMPSVGILDDQVSCSQ